MNGEKILPVVVPPIVSRLFPFLERVSLLNVNFENAFRTKFEHDEVPHRYLTAIEFSRGEREKASRSTHDDDQRFFRFIVTNDHDVRRAFEIFVINWVTASGNHEAISVGKNATCRSLRFLDFSRYR